MKSIRRFFSKWKTAYANSIAKKCIYININSKLLELNFLMPYKLSPNWRFEKKKSIYIEKIVNLIYNLTINCVRLYICSSVFNLMRYVCCWWTACNFWCYDDGVILLGFKRNAFVFVDETAVLNFYKFTKWLLLWNLL